MRAHHLLLFVFALQASAQVNQGRFQLGARATVSGMNVGGAPRTDLTTPIHDAAFRYDLMAFWRVGKDTTEWGNPGSIGAGIGLLRWGAETVYPLTLLVDVQPFRSRSYLRLDGQFSGSLGPWKETPQRQIGTLFFSEVGFRYIPPVERRWKPYFRVHAGGVLTYGPFLVLGDKGWQEQDRLRMMYLGIGIGMSF